MGSRTTMKQQIIRQMVMGEEKSSKEASNIYKNNWNTISDNNGTLPNLTLSETGSGKKIVYYKNFFDIQNDIHHQKDSNNNIGKAFPFTCNGYDEKPNNLQLSYSLHNMCSQNSKYDSQSFNAENNIDINQYNANYRHLNNNADDLSPVQTIYSGNKPYSCPVTNNYNSRRIVKSNSSTVGGIPEEKLIKVKERTKKESHNRIERKRRDFINNQIIELSHLLPPHMMTDGESKKNKGNILKNSVVYINHLHNETNYASNYVKETDMAFMLVDGYRKQIQELQEQLKSITSKDAEFSQSCSNLTIEYNDYMLIREQNRLKIQSGHQLLPPNNSRMTNEVVSRLSLSSVTKSPLSQSEHESELKAQPSSIQSSIGNTSLSTTYHIEVEDGVEFSSLHNVVSPINQQQSDTSSITSVPSMRSDTGFYSTNHYQGLGKQVSESMEC